MNKRLLTLVPGSWHPGLRWGWHHLTLRGSRRVVEWRMRRRARHLDTFNGRLTYKMLHDRRALLPALADKVRVKDYVESVLGPGWVAKTYCVSESAGEIDWDQVPREFVAKVNHGSGGIVIVTDDAPREARLPRVGSRVGWNRFRVRPEHADRERIADLCRHWLTLDYTWVRGQGSVQWCYSDIPRRVMVEELLRDASGNHPREYRLFVISGSVRFIQLELDVFGDHRTAIVDAQGELLDVRMMDPPPNVPPEIPKSLWDMVVLAEKLAEPVIDFVRVDMYDLGDRLVVGEMTHYPSGGTAPISSDYYSRLWAEDWVLPY